MLNSLLKKGKIEPNDFGQFLKKAMTFCRAVTSFILIVLQNLCNGEIDRCANRLGFKYVEKTVENFLLHVEKISCAAPSNETC